MHTKFPSSLKSNSGLETSLEQEVCSAMSNGRNGYPLVPPPVNQPNRHDSYAQLPGYGYDSGLQPPPASSSRSPPSRSDSIVRRRLLDPRGAHPGPFNSNPYPPLVHPMRQIPVHGSNSLQRQNRQGPAIIPEPATPDKTSRLAKDGEDEVLKKLRKVTYNPPPKGLLKNLSLYYRDQNRGGGKYTYTQDSNDEDAKRCAVCLEDFVPKETVTVTPCDHMFHEECIVPWLKSKGQCPVCRSVICEPKGDASAAVGSGHAGVVTANDLIALELLSVVRALEESFVFGYPRRY